MPAEESSIFSIRERTKNLTRDFYSDDSGTMTPFTVGVLLLMIVGAGIGADFMRYEAYRAELQNALDRGTLAATAFSQTEDPQTVVEEYVNDSERWEQLGYGPQVTVVRSPADESYFDPDVSERSVTATATLEFGTYFIRFLEGMTNDSLAMNVRSSSRQRQQRTELVLVLDVSYSMDNFDTTLNEPKVTILKREAARFINEVLTPETRDATSVTLVPFGGHVNPGLFGDLMTGTLPLANPVSSTFADMPFCPLFENHEFTGAAADDIDLTASRDQRSWFKAYGRTRSNSNTGDVNWSWCPQADAAIVPMTNDASEIITGIDSMNMYGGTGIDAALKWASYLTSDKSNAAVQAVAALNPDAIPSQFENRPAPDSDDKTNKIVVFLTDGNITHQRDLKPELMVGTVQELKDLLDAADADPDHPYASIFNIGKRDEIITKMADVVGMNGTLADFWATDTDSNLNRSSGRSDRLVTIDNDGYFHHTLSEPRSELQALQNVEGVCDRWKARGNVQVFTIGFNISGLEDSTFTFPDTPADVGTDAEAAAYVLGHCAIDPSTQPDASNRFLASGDNLGEIFSGIASEIFNLRLTN